MGRTVADFVELGWIKSAVDYDELTNELSVTMVFDELEQAYNSLTGEPPSLIIWVDGSSWPEIDGVDGVRFDNELDAYHITLEMYDRLADITYDLKEDFKKLSAPAAGRA